MERLMEEELFYFVKRTLTDNFLKLARVNILTGEYIFLKCDALMKEKGYEDIPSIYTYIKKQVSDHLVLAEYAPDYLKYSNPEYVKKRIFLDGDQRLVQNYKQKTQAGELWVTFGIETPREISPENPWTLFYWQKADADTAALMDAVLTLSTTYYKILRINLISDTFQVIKTERLECEHLSRCPDKIAKWYEKFEQDENIYPEDREIYRNFMDLERLRNVFREHTGGMQNCHYRRKIGDGWRWVRMELVPGMEYTDENQELILYVKDVHDEYLKEKQSREAMLDEYHRDALTRLYNRHKFNEDIKTLSQKILNGTIRHLTVCYVDVNGLHELNNKLGHERGDEMLCSVASAMKKYFPEDRVYRIGGDEFVIFSSRQSKESVERTMKKVRMELSKDHYEISVGAASGNRKIPIHKIVGAAELAMRSDKEQYYRQNGDRRKRRAINEEVEKALQKKKYTDRFLDFISNSFSGVFFVNLKNDTLQHIYSPDYFLEMVEMADDSYSRALQMYVEQYVRPEDYPLFQKALDYQFLAETLQKEKLLSFHYQKTDGSKLHLQIISQDTSSKECEDTIWIFSADGGGGGENEKLTSGKNEICALEKAGGEAFSPPAAFI